MEKLLRRFLQHNKLTQCYLFCFLIEFALAISCFFIFKNIYFCIISIIPIVLILFLILNNKIIEEIQIKCARRLSKFDILQKCFLACIFIFAPITIVKHILNNNDFGYVVLIPIFFVFATIETIKQNNNYKKEGKELFGNDYKNKFNTNIEVLKSIIIPLIYPYYVIAIFLLVLFAYPLTRKIIKIFITPQLNQEIYVNEIKNWGEFGDYIGGIFGTLLTLFTFTITLYMLYSQQKQIKMAREEFRQQQFETTIFANKLNEIKEHRDKIEKDNEVTKQFYQLLQITFREIHEYSNDKIIIKKHVDMLKTYLSNDILIKIFRDRNIPDESKKDNNDLFVNIRNIINKYALFQNLKLTCDQSDNNCYRKYKILAFENNIELMTYRISLETNAEELDKDEYVEHSNVAVRQAVAANPNTLEKTLNFLSIDKNNEVHFTALGNSNISTKILENKLKNEYDNINKNNIEGIIHIVFNNSQIYNNNIKFKEYAIKIINYLETKQLEHQYDERKVFYDYISQAEDNIFRKFVSLSIENILNNQNQTICYFVLLRDGAILSDIKKDIIAPHYDEIEKLGKERKIKECKNKITSVFKQHEDKLKVFLSQLKKQ